MRKTVLITGAGTGIGKGAAIALAKRGHDVIATTETDLQADELRKDPAVSELNLEIFKLDITLEQDRNRIASYNLDVLINNAAIGESGSLSEIDIDKVRNNFEVNVFSTFELTQIALKKMMSNRKGTVVFVSSLAGRITMPFLAPYTMTKFALSSGAETLRGELHRSKRNVHVCVVEPGGYHTGFNQRNIAKKYTWMNEQSYFSDSIDKLKKEETRVFKFTEAKSIESIVRKIVKATESRRPRLRYSAPWWQAFGVQVLRMLGK